MSETTPKPRPVGHADTSPAPASGRNGPESASEMQFLEEAVEYILADCAFAVGQAIGMRTTVDYDAIVWWHNHFRTKFLAAMRHSGNRWFQDRENVTAVGWMLGERAVRHAADRASIDVDAVRRAAADVERYCEIQAKRAAQADDCDTGSSPRLAGYWCVGHPY